MDELKHSIGVIGGGTMGRGIIQLLAQAGHEVLCHDAIPGAARKAADHAADMLRRGVAKGRMTQARCDLSVSRIRACESLADLAACDILIEAVIEDLGVKVDLFRALEGLVAKSAILATNTSSLPVSAIAGACQAPERVAGLHFSIRCL